MFDRPKVWQAMLEMEEETEYGPRGKDIANGINVGDNIAVPCETRMENSFDFYSMIKQCIL